MNKEYEGELKKISRVSGALIVLLGLLLIAGLVGMVIALQVVITAPTAPDETVSTAISGISINLEALRDSEFTSGAKMLLLSIILFGFAYILALVILSIRLLLCFRRRKLFTDESVRYARIIAWLYTVSLLAKPFIVFASSSLNGEGNLNLSPNGLIILGMVWLFAWMLQVGRALQLDSELAI